MSETIGICGYGSSNDLVKAVVWEMTSATAFDTLAAGDLFAAYKAGTTGSLVSGAKVLLDHFTGV